MRSRKVSPGAGGDAHDDLVGQHARAAGDRRAVAAGLADDGRRLAGDGRLVDRGDALDDLAVGRDHLAGRHDDDVVDRSAATRAPARVAAVRQPAVGHRLGAGLAQRRGLRLAAPLGHRLGEVGEQHGEPQPGRDEAGEDVLLAASASPRSRRKRIVVSTLPTSTTNMTGLRACTRGSSFGSCRRSPAGRSRPRTAAARATVACAPAAAGWGLRLHRGSYSDSCSTIGPSASAGKKVRPPTITTTPMTRPTNSGVWVGKVPGGRGQHLLAGERAGDGEHRDDEEEPADEHRDAEGRVHPVRWRR